MSCEILFKEITKLTELRERTFIQIENAETQKERDRLFMKWKQLGAQISGVQRQYKVCISGVDLEIVSIDFFPNFPDFTSYSVIVNIKNNGGKAVSSKSFIIHLSGYEGHLLLTDKRVFIDFVKLPITTIINPDETIAIIVENNFRPKINLEYIFGANVDFDHKIAEFNEFNNNFFLIRKFQNFVFSSAINTF